VIAWVAAAAVFGLAVFVGGADCGDIVTAPFVFLLGATTVATAVALGGRLLGLLAGASAALMAFMLAVLLTVSHCPLF
jgi:hypothetical protein